MHNVNLVELAQSLNDAGIPPRFEPDQARFVVQLWRQVARGQPVWAEQIKQIASRVEIDLDEANALIEQGAERDKQGRVVGFIGLSQNKHPHQFLINGQPLSTWCAWDSLFLPVMLNQTAKVVSTCPVTKNEIKLTITPDKVEQYEPTEAVMSIVRPKPTKSGFESVEEVWMIFCHQVHFFSSYQVANEWLAEKNIEGEILSIEEGYELGSLTFGELIKR